MYNSTVYVCVCILVYIIVRYSRFEYVIVRDINKKIEYVIILVLIGTIVYSIINLCSYSINSYLCSINVKIILLI